MTVHGHATRKMRTPTYHSWNAMMQRCNNPHHKSWFDYGFRGIKVAKRWHKFENFLTDMGERPDGTTLERINNNRGYNKVNCKWATIAEQNKNRRGWNPSGANTYGIHLPNHATRVMQKTA